MSNKYSFKKEDKEDYLAAAKKYCSYDRLVCAIDDDSITYSAKAVCVDPSAPDFSGTSTKLNDEEYVRLLFLLALVDDYGYKFDGKSIELEHVYDAPGRPKPGSKGSRADIIVRDDAGHAFLYIELKTPKAFSSDRSLIKGQLFISARLESVPPKYLVWGTIAPLNGDLKLKCDVIPFEKWSSYDEWHEEGEPSGNTLPKSYGNEIRRKYIKGKTAGGLALNHTCDETFFSCLVKELHDVLWGGGGTSSNEVFAVLTKLLLCKTYDEKETHDGEVYRFQVDYIDDAEEDANLLVGKMNELYAVAASSFLGASPSNNDAFDQARINASKIAYAVRKLEGISITRNDYDGDLLGKFFEEIVAHGFTQTKGQFFTPAKLVDFMLELADVSVQAKTIITSNPDGRGIRRFPYVIDPSCGVGTFLNSYMRFVIRELDTEEFRRGLTDRELETVDSAFAGKSHTSWARSSLYGIESNHDLGLAAKVNMILHGDGSMNTFITSGLLPFSRYMIPDRPQNVLSLTKPKNRKMNEQFDLVLSNPPFSVKFTEDDQRNIKDAFSGELGVSENLFIERWYQLLRPGGLFCCILPESVLDTKTEEKTRLWILARFKIKAIISLPYSAFQPYTGVKTCVMLAEKRSKDDEEIIENALKEVGEDRGSIKQCFSKIGALSESIFMAEPQNIGYKRRKGLPDLERASDLPLIAERYHKGSCEPSPNLGFHTTLEDVISRDGLRLDPKYRWLWDKMRGEVHIAHTDATLLPLSKWLEVTKLERVPKGTLSNPVTLVDLKCVDGRTGVIEETRAEEVMTLGSDKVSFANCDILFSKLEPYLGKIVLNPKSEFVGTTEWVGLKCRLPNTVKEIGFFLMLPEMLEVYRRLQSGKRHARLDISEVLELKVDIDPTQVDKTRLEKLSCKIETLKNEQKILRSKMDACYSEIDKKH